MTFKMFPLFNLTCSLSQHNYLHHISNFCGVLLTCDFSKDLRCFLVQTVKDKEIERQRKTLEIDRKKKRTRERKEDEQRMKDGGEWKTSV